MPTKAKRDSMVVSIERVLPKLKPFVVLQIGPHVRTDLDATDVMQEVALRALRVAPRLTFENDSATMGWLRMVTRRVAAEQARRSSLRPSGELLRPMVELHITEPKEDPAGKVELIEEIARALAALGRLTLTDRTLLRERFLDGKSNDHLAKQLACKPVALRVRLHRALDRLRRELR